MSARTQIAFRLAVRTLQAVMMTQIILGLARFFAPFTWTFSRAGSYAYTCTLHLGMDGRVDVINP